MISMWVLYLRIDRAEHIHHRSASSYFAGTFIGCINRGYRCNDD